MPSEKPLQTLYKALKEQNYDVPESYESFEKTLTEAGENGAESRHTIYKALKEQNYDVPENYESFYSTLFVPVNSTTSKARGTEEQPTLTPAKPEQAQSAHEPAKPVNNSTSRARGTEEHPALTPVKPATSVVPRSSNYLRDVTGDARNVVGSLVVSPAEVMGNERTGTEGAEVVGGKNLIKNPQNAKETWNEGMLSRDAFDRLYKYYSQASEGNSTNFTKLNDLIAKDKDLSNVPTSDLQDLLQQAIGLYNKKSAAIIAYNIVNDLPKGFGQEEMQDEINKAFFRYGTLPNMAYISDVGAKGAQGAGEYSGQKFYDEVKQYIGEMLQAQRGYSKNEATQLTSGLGTTDIRKQGKQFDERWMTVPEQNLMNVLFAEFKKKVSELGEKGERVGKEHYNKEMRDVQPATGAATGAVGFQGLLGIYPALQEERIKNRVADPSQAIESVINRLYAAQGQGSGGSLPTEDIDREAIGKLLYRKMMDYLVQQHMPKNKIEYVLKGFADSDIGNLLSSYTKTNFQRYLDDLGNARAIENWDDFSGLLAQGGHAATQFIADAWEWAGAGKVGGLLANSFKKRAVKRLAGEFVEKGINKKAAREIAERVFSQQAMRPSQRALLSSLHGAGTLGVQGFGSTAMRQSASGVGDVIADIQSREAQGERISDKDKQLAIAQAQKERHSISNVLSEGGISGLRSAGSGALFGAGSYIGSLAGSLAGKYFGDVANYATDRLSSLSSNALNVSLYDKAIAAATGQEDGEGIGEHFANNFITFGMLELLGIHKSPIFKGKNGILHPIKNIKEWKEHERQTGISADDESTMEAAGYGDLTGSIDKLVSDRFKTEETTEVSKTRTTEGASKINEQMLQMLSDPRLSEELKRKYYVLVTGDNSKQLSPAVSANIVESDDGIHVVTRNATGDVIQDRIYQNRSIARDQLKKITTTIDKNLTEALESACFENDANEAIETAYINAKNKLQKGEPTTEQDDLILSFKSPDLQAKYERAKKSLQSGETPTDSDLSVLSMYDRAKRYALENYTYALEIRDQVEKKYGIGTGGLDKAIEGHTKREAEALGHKGKIIEVGEGTYRTEEEQKAIAEYQRLLLDHASKKKIEDIEEANVINGDKNNDDNNANPVSEEKVLLQEHTEDEPVPSENNEPQNFFDRITKKKEEAYQRGVAIPEDERKLSDIQKRADIAHSRLEEAFANNKELGKLFVEAISSQDEENFAKLLKENELSAEQQSAIEGLVETYAEQQGVEDAIEDQLIDYEDERSEALELIADSNGQITKLTLDDGSEVFLKSGDITNEYGGVIVTDDEGNTRQIPVRAIKAVDAPISVDEQIRKEGKEFTDHLTKSYQDIASGEKMIPGQDAVISIAGEKVHVTMQGETGDGRLVLRLDDESDIALLPEDLADCLKAARREEVETTLQEDRARKAEKAEQKSLLSAIPKDEEGNPRYEEADAETSYDAILEQTDGDEHMADDVIQSMISDKKSILKKAEKTKVRAGKSISDKIAAEKERKEAIDSARAELESWEKIAAVPNKRRQEAERKQAEAERQEAEEERKKKEAKQAEEAKKRADEEEAARKEREAIYGVPDWTEDTATDARARGYRRADGKKYSRQGKVEVSRGKDVGVKFSDKLKATGYVALIEAEKAQPSHINGQANVLHFIPEAQPKKRTDEASSVASEEIAANINPEEITSSVIAYTGAPSVNERGEGIQGNNRLASLKTMWRRYPKQAEKYRQYLLDHAEEFGLSKEEIEKSKHPILVNVLPVTDAKAIELGQYDDKDITSGGTERIKAKNIVVKMGGDMKTFANRLLSSSDDDMSFAQLIDKNGIDVLKWLQSKHYISATQYKSAFNSRGNLTAEASNDLKSIMYQSIFTDGSERLEEMFNAMPAKAQKAILATAYRDYDSPSKDKMVPELQKSIMAFYELSKDEAFANATSMKDVRNAIETWRRQYQFDDATGESFLPTNKYSNFALELAAIYKSQTQRYMQSVFNSMYDLIQGRREADIFSQGNVDNRPRTLSEAIKEVLKIDYNGKTGSNIVGVGSETGIERRRGSTGDVERGGRGTEGERAADGNGRAKGDAGEEGVAPFSERLQNAIAETETEPTEAQKKAGNYKKGHLSFGGYDFTVETPKGVTRSGKDEQGKPWSVTMHDTYGYILGKIGVDGDHIDMFINDAADLDTFDGNVYVVDQVNPETGEFDEHKVMYGYPSEEAATEAYLANYSKGWKGLGKVTSVSKATFDKWLESSDRKTKPFADYAMVQKEQAKTNSDFIAQMEYDYENDIHPSEEDKPKMQKFVERLLNFHSDKEDKIDSGYTILSSNIQGDKLYPNEKKWFGTKKYRQGVSWVDKENACAYELNPRFNAQGYLTAVGVHKLVPLASFGRDVNEVKPSDIARATGKSQGKVTAKASKKQGKGEKKVEPGQQVDYYSAFAEQYGLDAEEAKKEAVANASEKAKEVKGLSNKLKDRYPTSLYLLGRDISDMEEMVANGEVSPKRVERVRSEIKRLKGLLADYERLATPEERSWRHKKAEHPDEIVVVDRGNGLLVVCQEDVKATNKAIGHKLDAPVTENLIVTTNEEQGMPFTTMRVTLADLQRLDDKGVKYVVLDKNGNQAKAKSKKQGKGEKKVEPGQQVDYYSAFAEQYGLDAEEAKKETEGNKPSEASLSLSTPLTDEEVVAITDAMKANATVAPTVEINDANWKESVETPVGSVKMGENQKAKLFAKGREQQYGMLLETLSNPDVVLEEKDKEQNMFHERPSSYLFVKTFQKEDGSKYVHFESVTVSQEGMEVSISSHIIRENQLKNKLKSDRLLYKATALDAPANTSAEQPIVGGSLSSDGKDTEKVSSGQEDGEKNMLSDLEREFQKALEHEEDVEQKWEVKILDYVAEHYPTQATVSAATTSAKGVQEREAMKSDPVLRAMRKKADAAYKKARDATFVAQKKMETSKEKMEAREHKADVVENPSHGEEVLRDAVIDKLRESGIEVLGATEGQKVLDMANGKDVRLEAKRKRALETASVSRDEKHQPTVVSSADGAKILNNLDTLATEYDNLKNYPKTFTGDVAKALGADRFGSGSEYATFETKNGQIVTIRLANHNARVSGFDHNKRDNGISIVISSKPNAGITNNGDAHIVEFYYDSIKLRRADGKPLAEIVRSIKQALYSGVFKDPTGLAERQEVNADDVISLQKVYHGSGADFDHFDHSHMGEGEGAQAYGWGTYVKITDHVRFFKTKNGEAYGFTVGGKIYIDPRIANAETPIHEYAHLWASALRSGNPKEWENVVGLMKGTPVWDEVKKRYPELETDEEIADEVIATYSGRRGAERLRREAAKIAGSMDELDAVKALSALQRVKEALKRFWKGVCDFLHIHFTSAEEVADRVMKDLLDGVDPRSMMDGGRSLRSDTEINIVEGAKEHGFKNYAEAKTWAKGHIARTYSGEETGGKGDIRISNVAVDKYLSQSAVDKSDSKDVHLSVLKVLPDVIRESVDAEQHADYKKGEDGVRSAKNGINPNVTIHRLYGAVRMDGKVYRVKVTLKEDKTSQEPKVPHSYEATKIELLAGTLGNSDNSLSPNTNNSITAAKLLNGVEKSYGGGRFFEDEDKVRLEEAISNRTLAGVHNISEDKLRKALKLGGLANPSVAVIDTDKQGHSGYGEISLVLPSSMVEKRTGRNAGTFFGDAWTPTYPQVERIFGKGGSERAVKDIESVPDVMERMTRNAVDSWLDGRSADDLAYLYLQEHGKQPHIVVSERQYPETLHNDVKEVLGGYKSLYDVPEERRRQLLDIYVREKFEGNMDEYAKGLQNKIQKMETTISKHPKSSLMKYRQMRVDDMKRRGYDYDALSRFVDDLIRDEKNAGKPLDYATMQKARDYIKENHLQKGFEEWKENLAERYKTKEVIFNGFTPSGKRRYVDNTLENVSKLMKQKGRNGAQGWGASFNNFAANIMQSSGTLKGIKSHKEKLTDKHEDIDAFTEKWGEVYNHLADVLNPNADISTMDVGYYRLQETAVQKEPKEFAKKEYGVELSDNDVQQLDEMVKAIREERPAMYFETKFERPVMLDEFAAAVVPQDLGADVRKGLEYAGLQLFDYDSKKEGDRKRAFDEAVRSDEKIRFQFIGEKGAERADHAEEVSTRLDNLAVAREMEEAKKEAKAIKMATGWERGADGKWRYEIPDAKIKDTIDVGGGNIVKRFEEDILWTDGKLEDAVDAPKLFEAYPQLKNIKIHTDAVMNYMPSNGYYNPQTKTITIHAADLKYLNSILNHEIQHAIQNIEGFAQGGNSKTVRSRIQKIIDDEKDASEYAKSNLKQYAALHMLASRLKASKQFAKSDQQFFKDKAREYYWDAMNELDNNERSTLINEYPDDKNAQEIAESGYHVDEAIKELKRIADEYKDEIPKGNMDAFEKVNKLTSALENKSDDELYQDLAGEVEARNVQKRMGMTPEERRNSLASETEDVDRGDQIVMNNGGTSYSIVKDPETIKKLDKEDTVKVYRAMQVGEDGKLYPPMAAKVKGKFVQPIELGKWEQADERPELADDKGMFTLNKGNGKSLKAAYNPYLHTSRTPLNDQFSEAQNRPNIVTVEVEVPKSELTSGYKADKAKDAVGEVEWKAGIIQGQLTGKRKVILSRWDKPVRIVPDSEVADVIVNDMFKGKNITMPSNVVTPSLRKELEKRGVPFVETDNRGRIVGGENDGVHYSKVYGKKANVKHRLGEPYDYEKYPLGRVEPNLATKEVKIVHADVSHGFKNYKEAKDWAKQNIAKVYSADETGNKGEVRISNSAIDKFLSQSAVDKSDTKDVHLSVLKVLPEVLKESIDAETHPDFLKGANGKRSAENGMNKDVLVHRCYGAVDIDGKVYRVKITLKEDLRDKSFPHVTHSYEATKIELLAGTWENPSKSPSPNTNNSISGAILLKNVEMSYNNRKNLLDESEKMGIPAENQRKIADSVIDTANQLGGAEAHVYTSFVDVPEEYKKEVEKGARGWYDPETHTVHVYLPNCASGDEAQRTVFHEKIGHEGIEVLFGGEEGVKDFAKFVFSSSGKEIREKVMEIADQYDPEWKHPDRTNVGTQEYIAKLAENGPQTAEEFSLWRKIKHYLIKAMKKLGLTIRGLMNDKDLRYYLLRAQQSLHVWDKMPEAKKRAMAEQASETEMKESLSNRPRKRKNETTAQYIERLRQWEKWKIALDKASVANDPLPEEETYHDKWDKQYRTDMEAWRKANDIAEGAEGPSEAPKRAEGESPQEYALRVADHERELDLWQGAPDYFSYLKKAQEDYRKAYEAWKERYDIDEMENVDLQLYGGETPTEGPADEDAYQEQEEIEHNVNSEFEKEMGAACGIDMSAEGARRKAIIAVIDRRKNLEGASAEDAIFIVELCKEIDALEKELGLGKGELRNELIHIIEQPLQQQEADAELERWVDLLNSMRVFHDAHSKVTVEGVKAVQPELQKLANVALKYGANPKDKSEREELHAASREVADVLNRYYQDVPGYHGLYGDDIIKIAKYAQHVAYAALLTQRSNELADNPKVRKIVEKIKNWYDEFFHLLEDAGLRGDAGYIGEGYVNHIWDKERSDQEAYERYVENYQRTKSSNMRHREIATYLDGIGVGLVPKFTDIGQIMSYYSRQNNEAIANRKFLDALSFLTIAHKNNDGEVTEVLPILNSHKPDRLDEEKYEMFHVPGIGDVWVLKEVAGKFSTIFGTMRTKDIPNWLSKLGKNYDLLASTMKKIQLSVSGFHALALSEVALAQMGPIKGMQAILKYILYDSAKHGWQVPAYVHTEDYKMAAKHLVQLGATQDYASADVNMITERFRKFVKNLSEDESFMKKVSGNALQPFAVAVDWINKGTDKLLWNYLHDGLKIACFKMMKEKIDRMAARKGLSETTRDRLLDEAGQYVNDTFGGQYWELLNIPPAALKWLRRLFLSPDWLISTMRHFFANFGRGSIYDPRNFLDYIRRVKEEGEDIYKYIPEEDIKEFRRFRQRSALYCYVLGVCVFYYTMMNALNALSRVKDVEKEKAKADEIRKTNPSYKSPYELAYPDGIKWYDYTMWGNSLGQQTHLFLGRYKDGTEMYVRWGKQFREFPELFIGRKGLDFPAPLIERMMGKANPVIGLIKDDLGALGIYGFNRSKEDEQLQEKYGKTIGLLAMNARHFLPFSLPTREDKEGKLIDLFMPSSKGFSRYKAIDYFKDFIKSGDMAGITKTYRAAMLNGIDAEKCLQAAITTLKAEQSEVLRSGVTDLSKAFAAYNNAKTLKEKKTLRTTLMKYLAASEYKAFTRDEAIKEVQDYLSGDAIETEKDNEKYILKSKAEDIRDDFRMSRIYNQSKKYVDNIKQAAKNGDREKSSQLRDRYSSWIEIYGISRKERTAVGKLKKMLGKGNDEAVMREIRNVRRQCQQEIDKVSPVR